jgi:hypothetical protein
MAAMKPVLSVPKDNGMCDLLIKETECGQSAVSPRDIAEVLKAWVLEWRERGSLKIRHQRSSILQYSREAQSREFAKFLKQVVVS